MKLFSTLFLLLIGLHLQAQVITAPDSINPKKGNREQQLKEIEAQKKKTFSDSLGNEPANAVLLDSTKFNKYGDLLHDDPEYNPRQPLWKPALEVIGVNAVFMGFNRYVAKVHQATLYDPVVCLALLKVMNLMAPPPSLFHPKIVWRVLRGKRPSAKQAPILQPAVGD